MLTITQAFDSMRQGLELTEAERAEASRQQEVVRGNLRQHLGGLVRDILSGSYARRTAIRPLDDIDLFIVLDPNLHSDVRPSPMQNGASPCLNKVYGALARAYPNRSALKLQNRSVNIAFSGTGIGYDIVPAFENRAGVYMIPDRERGAWIETNPEAHAKALVSANDRAGGKLNPLIKMAKLWKREHGVPLRSFHLEVMSYSAFSSAPGTYAEGMRALFGHLANAVQYNCANPAGVGPNIDAGMAQAERTAVRTKLVEAEQVAARALQFEGARQTEAAHKLWRGLFGKAYPEG
jgi:hypothetical protein